MKIQIKISCMISVRDKNAAKVIVQKQKWTQCDRNKTMKMIKYSRWQTTK